MYLTGAIMGGMQCEAKKPETIAEKIQAKFQRNNEYDFQTEIHNRISKLENNSQIAIVTLCEEIEELKKRLNDLNGKAFVLTDTKK